MFTRVTLPPRNFHWGYARPRLQRKHYACDRITGKRLTNQVFIRSSPPVHAPRRCEVVHCSTDDPEPRKQRGYVFATGILFYAYTPDNELVFLLGQEQSSPSWKDSERWADFGGGVEVTDTCVTHAAAREAYEETMGCVTTQERLREALESRLHVPLICDVCVPRSQAYYRMHVMQIPFRDYDHTLSNFREFLKYVGIRINVAEKLHTKWVSLDTLRTAAGDALNKGKEGRAAIALRVNFADTITEIDKRVSLDTLPNTF